MTTTTNLPTLVTSDDVTSSEDVEGLQMNNFEDVRRERVVRRTTAIIIPLDSRNGGEEMATEVLDALHEDHKNVCPLMCLGLLYVLLTGDTSWFCLSMLQIGIQSLMLSRKVLRNPFARRITVILSLTMLITSLISISAVRPKNFQTTWQHQMIVFFFIITAFVGFVLTNLYNMNLLFIFEKRA